MYRFWWLYGLLGLAFLGWAGWHAGNRGAGWGVHVGLWSLLGLCFFGMAIVGRVGRRTGARS